MSLIYETSKILCPCLSPSVDYHDVLNGTNFHNINDLYFCPSCQTPKCKYCIQSYVYKKYCCNCMTDYSGTDEIHCSKNCFSCPDCDSLLTITVFDDKLDDVAGKKFKFTCTLCSFIYETAVITQPKSLLSIIKNEYNESNKLAVSTFHHITTIHKHKLNYEILQNRLVDEIKNGKKFKTITPDVVEKLKQFHIKSRDGVEEIDKIKAILSSNEPIPISAVDTEDNLKAYPIPKRLTAKNTLKCSDCNHVLLHPTEVLLSTKFSINWNANDFLPIIKISPLRGEALPATYNVGAYNFLLNIICPLPYPAEITLNAPFEYNIGQCKVTATIPVSKVNLDAYGPDDHVLRGIPTPFLTKNTKISRAELVMRTGQMNANDSIDLIDSHVEHDDNWYLVPIEIILSEPIQEIQIPILVNVRSKLPEAMRPLNLSKKELNSNFWTLVNIP